MRLIGAAAGPALGLAAGAAAWGVVVERQLFTIRRATLPVLAPGTRDLTVLHLSDLHMAPWQRAKQRFVRELADLEPDLVIDTGDNLGHEIGLLGVKAALEPFRGVPGVFVWGSNDYWAPSPKNPFAYLASSSAMPKQPRRLDLEALGATLTDLGWSDLNNAVARVVAGGVPLDLLGVDDPHRGYDRLAGLPAKLGRLRGRKVKGAATLGVTHAPYRRVLDAFVTGGADAVFAGHTHGGQIQVPGYGALVTNCDLPRTQVRGLTTWSAAGRSALLNVSAGLGTSIYAPVRFACRPEVSLLTLTAQA